MQSDKAGKEYWDAEWARGVLPEPVRPAEVGYYTRVNSAFHEFFSRTFRERGLPAGSLLEIGCAQSIWLPYFALEYGFAVHGLDYSERGCESSRAVLERSGVAGTVHHGDLLAPAPELEGQFDVVVSFGVMEHFPDTAGGIGAAARLVRPGGVVCTLIPNLTGLVGLFQKFFDRSVYDIHVPIDREGLAAAHRAAGLDVLDCRYLVVSNLSVVNANAMRMGSPRTWRMLMRVFSVVDRFIYLMERLLPWVARPNAFTSPYVACVAAVHGKSGGAVLSGASSMAESHVR